mmetsp:Transcript_13560/g.40909  ORF Transcript_13560/g.40909 Transcript_13560/m.40909 type:complete len:1472 (+) Transcript_13560:117-4532(+)
MSTSAHHRAKPTKQQSDTHLLRAVHSTRSLADQTFGQQKTHLNEHPKSSSSSGHPRSERTRGELRNEEEPPSHQSPHYSHSSKMTSQQPQGALDALVHTNDSSPDVSDRRSAPVLRRHRTSPASTVAVHAAQARSRRLLLKQRYINTSLPPPATATHASSLYNAGAAPPSTSSFASASPLPHASGGVAASCTFPTTAFDPSQRHNDGGSSSRTQQHDHMPSWLFENARAFSSPTLLSQAQPTAMSSTSQGSSAPHTQRPPHQHHTQPHSLQSAPAASALKRELSPSPHTTHSSRGGSTQSRAHRTSRRSPSPSASPDSPPSLSHLARHLSAGSLTVPKHAQPLSSSSSQTRNPAQEQPPSFSAAQIHPGSAASRSPASIHRGGLRTAPATAPASSPSSSSSSQRQRHATDSATALSPSASRKARALRAASTVPFLQTKSASSTTHERASKMAAATRATLRDSGRSASHGANLVGSAVAALSSPGAPIAQRTSVSNADTNHRSHPSTESATAAAAARLSNAAAASPSQHPQRPRARTHAAALTDDRTPPSQTADDPLPVHPRHRAQTHASAATLLQSAHRPPLVSFASEPRIAHVRFDGRRGRSDAESDDDDEALGEEGEDEEEVQGEDEEDNDEELEQEEELELKQQQQQNTGQRRAHSKEQAHRKSSAAADHERSRAEDRSLGDARSRSARLRSSKSKSAVALHTSLTLTDHTGTETANHELARGCVQVATDARRRSSSTLPSVERCDAGFQEEDQHSPEGARSAHNAAGRHGNVHDTATRKRRVLGSLLGSKTVSLTSLSQALDRLTDATSSEDESFPFSFHEHEPWEDQIAYTSALLTDARSSGYRPRSAKKSRWVDTIFGGDSTNESSATSQTHRSPPRAGRLIATDAELEQEPHEPASHQSLPHKPQHSQPPSHETRSPRQPHGSSSTQQQQQQQHSHQRTPSLGHSKSSTVTFSDAFPASSAHSSTTSSTRSRPVSSSVLASSTRSTTTGSSSTAPVPAACHVSFSPAYASSPAASDEESSARLRLSSEEQHELNVALWEAVSTGNADETARLVESGADVMYIDESGADLLLTAARHNNAEITALLLQSGPEVQRLAGRALALATDEEVRTLLTDCMDYYMEKEQHEQELEREAVLAVAELDESDMASSGGSKAIGFAKTSETHPMQVDFVKSSLVLPGRLGMCMCPGRNKPKKGFRWARDATSDVIRIRDVYRGEVVVSLVRDQEKARMGISDLTTIIEEQGLQSISCPITDKWIPSSMDMLCELVIQIMGLLRNGRSVIIHCNGGKGRTGMVVVAVLLAMGLPSIRDAISVCRSSSNGMLKNPAQQFYLRYFKKVWYKKRRTASVRELMEQNKKVHRSDKDFFKERSSGTLAREKSRGRFAFVKRPSMVVLRRSSRAGLTESAPAMRSSAEALSSSGKESCSVNVDSADNTVPCTLSSTSVGSVTGSDEFDDDESPSSGSEEE